MSDDRHRLGFVGPAFRPGGRPGLALLVPGLLVGEYPTPADVAWLRKRHRVTAVLSLQDDADLMDKGLRLRELEAAYGAEAVAFHRIPVADGDTAAMAAALGPCLALLGDLLARGGCAYVHCNAGFNRAPTVAIAYLHAHHGLGLDEARDLVKSRRACVPYMRVLEAHFRRVR